MRVLVVLLLGVCLACGSLDAAELLRNGSFAAAGDQPGLAADWEWPAGSGWQRAAAGGPDGKPCLLWKAQNATAGAALQRADFATPQTTYVLRVVSRSDGRLVPTVRLVDRHEDKELLPPVELSTSRNWEARRVEFKTLSADFNVEIYADASLLRGAKTVSGEVALASVEISAAAEQKPRQTIPNLGENLALTRPYTMSPAPSYSLCADPDDKVQLTDGVYTQGHFWTRPTTVGWGGSAPKFITIDLGHDLPLKGVSLSTAGGVAGVNWPRQLWVFVSPDGEKWYKVGDLAALGIEHDPLPLFGEYSNYRFWTDKLRTHGRYVQIVGVSDSYFFVDEIEVYRGDDSFMAAAYPATSVADVKQYMGALQTDTLVAQQLRKDLKAVAEDIATLPADKQTALQAKVADLGRKITAMPSVPMAGFKAILPMLPLERDIFALQAEVWRAQGKPTLRLWTNQRWDPLEPSQEPGEQAGKAALSVRLAIGEHRAATLNLTNAADRPLALKLKISGLPGGTNPASVQVHRVEHVGTRWFDSVAAALPEAPKSGDGYALEVPAGMTRQVWLSVDSTGLKAGEYTGKVEISGQAAVPLKLTVYPVTLPKEQTLCLGGWDYTQTKTSYGIKPTNYDAVVKFLQEYGVNMPWASGSAVPFGEFDAAGNMKAPATGVFDYWLSVWPKAKLFAVFLNAPKELAGEKMGTERFNTMVGNWAHFWAKYLRDKGLKPSQLALLIYDEPHDKTQYDLIVAWAKAIKAAEPELRIWEDPQPQEAKDPVAMLESCDIIVPYRGQYLSMLKTWMPGLYEQMRRQGKDLWFYNADGPARTFDPYSYYLVQQWHVFVNGGGGSCFWAFSDDGGVDNWNEYPAKGNGPYCPYYLDETSLTTAKYMEAIREGVQDYELLTMLKQRVAALEKKGVAAGKLAAAQRLLIEGPQRVLAEETGRIYRWDEPKHREVQDVVRVEVLEALVALQKL